MREGELVIECVREGELGSELVKCVGEDELVNL